jgi:hypothetical protein
MPEAHANEQAEPNTLKDKWGEEHKWDPERYPEDSAAREGKITKPSGQGGATPKARPDHQDMFPKNPEPSEHAKAQAELNEKVERGEMSWAEAAQATLPAGKGPKESASDREARTARVAGKDSPK